MMINNELITQFQKELERIGGNYSLAQSDNDTAAQIIAIANRYDADSIVFGGNPNLKNIHDLFLTAKNSNGKSISEINNLDSDPAILQEKLSKADIGISYAYCIVAETGSVVLLSSQYEPRSLSLLPGTSIIIANSKCVVPELAVALELLQKERGFQDLSCVTIISGPSRTADIEKVLVTGVHGPKNLHVILI
jgi:L-lactate dehydrogenase complex protein LldG